MSRRWEESYVSSTAQYEYSSFDMNHLESMEPTNFILCE